MAQIKTLFFICVFMLGINVHLWAQNRNGVIKNEKSLTEVLQIISKKQKKHINYNPAVTNRIYIKDVSNDKNVVELLNKLLVNNDLEIKKAGSNYLYVRPLQKILLKGCVKSKETKSSLSNINVFIDSETNTRTDANGNFSFTLRKGNHKLTFKDKSYYPKTMSISLVAPTNYIIELKKIEQKKVKPQTIYKETKNQDTSINIALSDSLSVQQSYIPYTLPDSLRKEATTELLLPKSSPKYALKSNLILWGLTSPNLAVERKINKNFTAELLLGLNVGKAKQDKQSISYLIQPEIRYWLSRSFSGTSIGYHIYYAHYGAGDIIFPFQRNGLSGDNKYEGHLYGMGASLGYQWSINKHWNIEAVAGAGYVHLAYDKITWNNSWKNKKSLDYNYWGLTKASINLVYAF